MLQLNEINKDGEYIAIGDNGKQYDATYCADLACMFFCIPASVEVVGYIEK